VAAITVVWLDWAMMTLSSTESANPDFYQPERNHLGPARLLLVAEDAKTSVTALCESCAKRTEAEGEEAIIETTKRNAKDWPIWVLQSEDPLLTAVLHR
jgi:hypothetical protein